MSKLQKYMKQKLLMMIFFCHFTTCAQYLYPPPFSLTGRTCWDMALAIFEPASWMANVATYRVKDIWDTRKHFHLFIASHQSNIWMYMQNVIINYIFLIFSRTIVKFLWEHNTVHPLQKSNLFRSILFSTSYNLTLQILHLEWHKTLKNLKIVYLTLHNIY